MNYTNRNQHADKVYHFLSNNAIPLQINHTNNIKSNNYLSPRPPNNYYNLKFTKPHSPIPLSHVSKSPSAIQFKKPEPRVVQIPQQKPISVTRWVQVSPTKVDQSSQIEQTPTVNISTQTEQEVQTPNLLSTHNQKAPSIRFSEVLKLRRQEESQNQTQQGPRQVTSYINQVDTSNDANLAVSRNSIDYLDFQVLMQIVFLKDPYTFQELTDIQDEQEDAKAFITNVSKQIESGIQDLDQTDLNSQEQIAKRAKSKLKLFQDIIQKSLKALENMDESAQVKIESSKNDEDENGMKYTGGFPVSKSTFQHFQTFEQRAQYSMGTEDMERELELKKKFLQSDVVEQSDSD